MKPWKQLFFDSDDLTNAVKPHFVPAEIEDRLILNIERSYGCQVVGEIIEEETAWLDPGGIVKVDSPSTSIELDGYRLGFDLVHTTGVLSMLESAQEKPEGFTRIYGWWFCLAVPNHWMPDLKRWTMDQFQQGDALRQQMLEDLFNNPHVLASPPRKLVPDDQ